MMFGGGGGMDWRVMMHDPSYAHICRNLLDTDEFALGGNMWMKL